MVGWPKGGLCLNGERVTWQGASQERNSAPLAARRISANNKMTLRTALLARR